MNKAILSLLSTQRVGVFPFLCASTGMMQIVIHLCGYFRPEKTSTWFQKTLHLQNISNFFFFLITVYFSSDYLKQQQQLVVEQSFTGLPQLLELTFRPAESSSRTPPKATLNPSPSPTCLH